MDGWVDGWMGGWVRIDLADCADTLALDLASGLDWLRRDFRKARTRRATRNASQTPADVCSRLVSEIRGHSSSSPSLLPRPAYLINLSVHSASVALSYRGRPVMLRLLNVFELIPDH